MSKLTIGKKAPKFKGLDQNGNAIQLADFEGQTLVIYFYPKDNTPGCTAQACDIRDNYKALNKKKIAIIGVSCDDEKSHNKFIDKFELPFPLIADTDQKMVSQFGVWVEKSMYGRTYMGIARTTFIIDAKGIISHIIEKVDTKNHSAQILAALA
jgi:thioredoxin-dependent peroxiredoxin